MLIVALIVIAVLLVMLGVFTLCLDSAGDIFDGLFGAITRQMGPGVIHRSSKTWFSWAYVFFAAAIADLAYLVYIIAN